MGRIRSIHPEQWTDERFVGCSPLARLLALALRNEADDHGVFEWKPITLKMRLLPADNCDVSDLLLELMHATQITKFDVDGKSYGAIRNFMKFQRPQKPKYRYPEPPGISKSTTAPQPITDQYDTNNVPIDDKDDNSAAEVTVTEGGRVVDEEKGASATPRADPAVELIAAMDRAIVEVFGPAQARQWPNQTDYLTAKALLTAGVSSTLMLDVTIGVCQRLKSQGKQPPGTMRYLDRALREAALNVPSPAPPPPPDVPDGLTDAERQQRRHLESYIKSFSITPDGRGLWMPSWPMNYRPEGGREGAQAALDALLEKGRRVLAEKPA